MPPRNVGALGAEARLCYAAWGEGTVHTMATQEIAAGREEGSGGDPAEHGLSRGGRLRPDDPLWLVIDRLEDLRRAQEKLDAKVDQQGKDLRADIQRLDAKVDGVAEKLDAKIDNLRNYIVIPVVLVLLAAILAHFVPGL